MFGVGMAVNAGAEQWPEDDAAADGIRCTKRALAGHAAGCVSVRTGENATRPPPPICRFIGHN